MFRATGAGARVNTLNRRPGELPPSLEALGVELIWPETRGEGIVVGIVDTGCDAQHVLLRDAVADARSFLPGRGAADGADEHGHGTHVAGVIRQVAPGARLVVAKALDGRGEGEAAAVADAVRWLAGWTAPGGERVSVINMSLGGSEDHPDLQEAVRYAAARDVLVVAAAGNDGSENPTTSTVDYPARYPEPLAVTAVHTAGLVVPADFASDGPEVDVAGPGMEIASAWPGNRWAVLSGTSMATPHLSGAAALVASRWARRYHGAPTEAQLAAMLIYSTVDVLPPGFDVFTGAGLFTFAGLAAPRPSPTVRFRGRAAEKWRRRG